MIRYFLLLVILILAGSCGGGSTDSQDSDNTLFTELGIRVSGSEIYTESERIDAFIVIDIYWDLTYECVLDLFPDMEERIEEVFPESFTINIKTPQLSESGQEYFPCSASPTGRCSELIAGRWIATVPGLPAVGHGLGHFWNERLTGHTSNDTNDLSGLCDRSAICHEYMVNNNLFNCGGVED